MTIISCYCPPDKNRQLHTLPLTNQHLLIAGDVNGHSPSWGYQDLNSRGDQIEDWMIENNLILINKPNINYVLTVNVLTKYCLKFFFGILETVLYASLDELC